VELWFEFLNVILLRYQVSYCSTNSS